MPNQPKTPTHTVRVPNQLWDAANKRAHQHGSNVATVVRDALTRYVNEDAA